MLDRLWANVTASDLGLGSIHQDPGGILEFGGFERLWDVVGMLSRVKLTLFLVCIGHVFALF